MSQPGGLMSIVTKPFSVAKTVVKTDPTSNVQTTQLRLNDRTITVINVYVPHSNRGPTTTYTQTIHIIRQLHLDKPDTHPKTYVYDYLRNEIIATREAKHSIVVGGDFNESYVSA